MSTHLQLNNNKLISLDHKYIHAATSDNTRRAYQSDIKHFVQWGGLLPASSELILSYLHYFANTLNPRTLDRRLTAIKQWHLLQGFFDPTSNPLIRKTLKGIKNLNGKPKDKATAMSLDVLSHITHQLQQSPTLLNTRNNALLQIGFFGAFRASELLAIQWPNVAFCKEGVEILIPKSKTDQEGEGAVCAIPFGNDTICPVKALQAWQDAHTNQTSVFLHIKNEGITIEPLTLNQWNLVLKALVKNAGIPHSDNFSSHSLRRGFATEASRSGAPFGSIMRQGRWKHEGTVLGYIEEGKRFDQNAVSVILKKPT